MFTLAVIAHDAPQTTGTWLYMLVALAVLLVIAILGGLWWAKRRLPPVMDDGQVD